MIAVLDYGIGNLRSAEKALQHVGAAARLVARSGRGGRRGRRRAARRRRVRSVRGGAATRRGSAGPAREAIGRGRAVPRHLRRLPAALRGVGREPGRPRPRRLRRHRPGAAGRREAPADAVEPARPGRAAVDGLGVGSPAGRRSAAWTATVDVLRPLVRARTIGPETVATCDYGGPVAAAAERGHVWGSSSTRRSPAARGSALLGNFVARCAVAPPARLGDALHGCRVMELPPGDRPARRARGPAGPGRLRPADRTTATRWRSPARSSSSRRPLAARRRSRRAPGRASRSTGDGGRAIVAAARGRRAGAGGRRGPDGGGRRRAARPPACDRVVLGTAARSRTRRCVATLARRSPGRGRARARPPRDGDDGELRGGVAAGWLEGSGRHGRRAARPARRGAARRGRRHRDRARRHAGRPGPRRAGARCWRRPRSPVVASGGVGSGGRPAIAGGRRRGCGRRQTGRGARRGDRRQGAGRRAADDGGGAGRVRTVRVIPCLDVDGGRVVKGVQFVGLRTPATRSSWPRGTTRRAPTSSSSSTSPRRRTTATTMVDVVARTAEQVFIPLTVGGGVRTVEDAPAAAAGRRRQGRRSTRPRSTGRRWWRSSRRSSAPSASSSRSTPGPHRTATGWEVYTHGGRRPTGLDALAWAERSPSVGGGEILLTSMDRDGTRDGFDLELDPGGRRRGRRPGRRLGRRRDARPPGRGGDDRRAPTRCWPRRSSTCASTRSPRPRRTWRPRRGRAAASGLTDRAVRSLRYRATMPYGAKTCVPPSRASRRAKQPITMLFDRVLVQVSPGRR